MYSVTFNILVLYIVVLGNLKFEANGFQVYVDSKFPINR